MLRGPTKPAGDDADAICAAGDRECRSGDRDEEQRFRDATQECGGGQLDERTSPTLADESDGGPHAVDVGCSLAAARCHDHLTVVTLREPP